jgi:hypothetical protein
MSVDAQTAAAEAERLFLERLRRRVAWQALAAYPELAPPPPPRRWTIARLERLLGERAHDFPDRVDEWRWQLRYLRFHAAADGTLPTAFDGFVESAFAGLV